MRRCIPGAIAPILLVAHLLSGPRAVADDNVPAADADGDDETPLQAAKRHMQRFEMRDADGQPMELVDHPLLSFGDLTRGHNAGALWVWGNPGRPAALMELWRDGPKSANWHHSITLISPQRIELITPEAGRWQPVPTPTEPVSIDDAPPPAKQAAGRLRQLRELARRFSAHELWDSRHELRLLAQPVCRYSDSPNQIVDGAGFVFAHDTNPEAVLFIELLGRSLDDASWEFSVARSTHAELHFALDGKEVWTCERTYPRDLVRTKPYWAFGSPVEKPEATEPP